MKSKKRVDNIEVERKYDFFIVVEPNGAKHTVYADDYDKVVKMLMQIDETVFKDCYIDAETMAKKMCEMHPELETKMLRPTGKYYSLYHLALKIMDYYRYIDYYKDGSVRKNKKFVEITPVVRGVDRWV